jgi:hypothetical protein
MNDHNHIPLLLRRPEPPPDDVDRLLRDFFRAEMPDPWPRMSRPEARPARPTAARSGRWLGLRRQVAVAASVALVLVGYLALARSFPGPQPANSLNLDQRQMTGKNLPVPKPAPLDTPPRTETVPLRNGERARLLFERDLPGGGGQLILQKDITPAGR